MKLFLLSFTLSAFLTSNCFAITRGVTVTSDIFISKSAVGMDNRDTETPEGTSCTGTLVAADLVLIGAHCLIKNGLLKLEKNTEVDLSAPELRSDKSQIHFFFVTQGEKEQRDVEQYRFLPGYRFTNNSMPHDMALVKLKGKAPEGYKAARLLRDQDELAAGMKLTIAGFGIDQSSSDPENSGGTLRAINAVLANPLDEWGNLIFEITPHQGLDYGDSGGPAYMYIGNKAYVAGVASGHESFLSRYYWDSSRYAAVAPNSEWIKATAKEMGSAIPELD